MFKQLGPVFLDCSQSIEPFYVSVVGNLLYQLKLLCCIQYHLLHLRRGSEDWHEMFGKCAGNEIYDIRLGASKMFRPYCGKTFTHTAFHVHKKYVDALINLINFSVVTNNLSFRRCQSTVSMV